jgi:hypothetical protein
MSYDVSPDRLRELLTRTCQYPGNQPGQQHCGVTAVFSVLKRDFDPVHPTVGDNYDCCEAHLAPVVTETDAPDPGYVVHVTVISPGKPS